jgi:hypothetical protein
MLRQQFWYAVLAGACGHVMGNNPTWFYGAAGRPVPSGTTWQQNLYSPGCYALSAGVRLVQSLPWWALVPDTTGSVLTAGAGTDTDEAPCARASDGSVVMAYLPTSRQVTIAMSQLASPTVRARWFDPSRGAWSTIGTFGNVGTQNFTPANGDWVLMLDAAA